MTEITGGDAAYQALRKLNVTHVFGIPSVHNLPIFDAIQRGGEIQPVIVRHEQAAVHSADGYARASGNLGVALVSTGPGTTNTVTGLYEAAFASSKVLVLTTQVESTDYGKGRGAGHQAENQLPMLRTVARCVESPRYTQDIAPAIFRVAADVVRGRPQPGCVEIPIDVQYGTTSIAVGNPIEVLPVAPNGDAIDRAVELLADSSRRVIVAGGGVESADASAALVRLAEALDAPVFTSANGRGSIPSDHPLSMGPYLAEAAAAIDNAEVVLAIGTWFRAISGPRELPGRLIHVDVDPLVHGLNHAAAVSVIADAGLALDEIHKRLNTEPGDSKFLAGVQSAVRAIKQETRKRIGSDMERIMDTMTAEAGDAIIVRDMTTPAYAWGNQLLPINSPRSTMNPVSAAIGPGLPLANGAATATGRKTVIIQGDGGFMVHIGELSTAVQYQLPLVICVFTDGGYGVLRGIQSSTFDGRQFGVNLATPNFVTVARGMGMHGEAVKGSDEFVAAFQRAMQAAGPVLLDIDMRTLQPMEGLGAKVEFTQPE